MRTSILKTSRPELEDIVQYFIFFRSEGKRGLIIQLFLIQIFAYLSTKRISNP
jgi:hypothetical protein